jgi:N-acetylmuramoyl-L-alanine amidase
VRHWAAPEHIRIVVDVVGNFSYTVQSDGRRLVFNLPQAKLATTSPRVLELKADPVRAVMLKQKWDTSVGMEIFLSRPARFQTFSLPPWKGKPYRLVVDVDTGLPWGDAAINSKTKSPASRRPISSPISSSPVSSPSLPHPEAQQSSPRVVVIDAGHGGEDPGAVRRGVQEKVITLDISKRVAHELGKDSRYRIFLTRQGDYYVSFRDRTGLARQKGAALFVSIHVDAALDRRAKGASVYVLSLGGASNEAARMLAQWENLADLVGGVNEAERREESDAIVLSMFQTHTINSSLRMGKIALQRLGRVATLKYKEPQSARFRVLMLPDVPSLLLEVGFISNFREEALLRTATQRQRLATAIATAIQDFLDVGTP